MARRCASCLTRTYDLLNTDANALVKTKDPNEYLRKLRFHQQVKSTRDYGLRERLAHG